MNEERMRSALEEVAEERRRQFVKWGDQDHDPAWWLAILTEEVGEFAQSILHDKFGGYAAGLARGEIIQVAAVAVQILEMMDAADAAGGKHEDR